MKKEVDPQEGEEPAQKEKEGEKPSKEEEVQLGEDERMNLLSKKFLDIVVEEIDELYLPLEKNGFLQLTTEKPDKFTHLLVLKIDVIQFQIHSQSLMDPPIDNSILVFLPENIIQSGQESWQARRKLLKESKDLKRKEREELVVNKELEEHIQSIVDEKFEGKTLGAKELEEAKSELRALGIQLYLVYPLLLVLQRENQENLDRLRRLNEQKSARESMFEGALQLNVIKVFRKDKTLWPEAIKMQLRLKYFDLLSSMREFKKKAELWKGDKNQKKR